MGWKSFLIVSVLFLSASALTSQSPERPKPPQEYVKVEVKGTLRHGVMAIGGEHTGTDITAKGITWELDLRKQRAFAVLAEKLHGKTGIVTGTLALRKGVEVPKRWIVTVTRISEPKTK